MLKKLCFGKRVITLNLGGLCCCLLRNHGGGHKHHVAYGPLIQSKNDAPCLQEGWRASDNAIGIQNGEFPTGQLGKRIRAINAINKCHLFFMPFNLKIPDMRVHHVTNICLHT